jgi:GLPGLI family protein
MKKIVKVVSLLVAGVALFAFTNTMGDSNFEGVITFGITFGSDANPQVAQMMQGSTIKTFIKGNKIRSESNFGMFKSVSISDKTNPESTVTLIELMGNKYQVKMDDKAKKQAEATKPEIKYLDGTKTIAGYVCKEAQAIMTDKKTGNKYTSDIYYTDQLPYNNEGSSAQFSGLKGCPLSFSMTQQGTSFTMTCQSIQKQSVPDSLFQAPAGYKLMTQEEMQKDIMQKMQGGGGQ